VSGICYAITVIPISGKIGITLVAGVFSIPFSKKFINSKALRTTLVLVSSILCFAYGCYVIYENLFA
jgi:hypothetical protein